MTRENAVVVLEFGITVIKLRSISFTLSLSKGGVAGVLASSA
jgi:ABC-type branched-subunit amino acid transport system permease subunit